MGISERTHALTLKQIREGANQPAESDGRNTAAQADEDRQ